MVPFDCSHVIPALRSAQADAAAGHDRRALALSTGLLAAAATNRDIAGALDGNRCGVVGSVTGPAAAADGIAGVGPPEWPVPRQPATMVTPKTRMASTANRAVRGPRTRAARPRACLPRRSGAVGGILSGQPSRRPP